MRKQFKLSGKYIADTFTIDEVIASLSAQKMLIEEGINFLAELDPDFNLVSYSPIVGQGLA